MFLLKGMGWGSQFLICATLVCGYLGLRGPGLKKIAIQQGELLDRALFIAQRSGVTLRQWWSSNLRGICPPPSRSVGHAE
jgi:hypothetical protein